MNDHPNSDSIDLTDCDVTFMSISPDAYLPLQDARDLAMLLTQVSSSVGDKAPPSISLRPFGFSVEIEPEICFSCEGASSPPKLRLALKREGSAFIFEGDEFMQQLCKQTDVLSGFLWCFFDEPKVHSFSTTASPSNSFADFKTRWMDFFRRGCWLSGCQIECTEHEKLEWVHWLQKKASTSL
ncbi:hypothetical protein EON83_19580 [bacterium]|nr:MAG: hypothetical protein EON83_19580 [bacterium]